VPRDAAEENNAENLLVINDEEMAREYTKNWAEHLQHSEPYEGPVKSGESKKLSKQG
jgi:phosphatidylserine/phosphatidylglycerophosphate/cardiolipin synthase-like enzyme